MDEHDLSQDDIDRMVALAAKQQETGVESLYIDRNAEEEKAQALELLHNVPLNVSIELGRASMRVEDVLRLGAGSVVELDKLAGEPVDILANDVAVARGEVVIRKDRFCVRVTEVLDRHAPLTGTA